MIDLVGIQHRRRRAAPFPIELLQSSLTLRNPFTKPDIAQKSDLILPLDGTVLSGKSKVLLKVDEMLTAEIERLCEPMVRASEKLMPNGTCYRVLQFELRLNCVKVGQHKVHRINIVRMLSGHPMQGWGLQYDPYHHEMRRPWPSKLWSTLGLAANALRRPRQTMKRRRQMQEARLALHVRGIIDAISTKVITPEEAESRLTRLGKQSRRSPEALVQKYVPELAEATEESEKRVA